MVILCVLPLPFLTGVPSYTTMSVCWTFYLPSMYSSEQGAFVIVGCSINQNNLFYFQCFQGICLSEQQNTNCPHQWQSLFFPIGNLIEKSCFIFVPNNFCTLSKSNIYLLCSCLCSYRRLEQHKKLDLLNAKKLLWRKPWTLCKLPLLLTICVLLFRQTDFLKLLIFHWEHNIPYLIEYLIFGGLPFRTW